MTVYDRQPDPRADAHWSEYGCTRGGGDGRMFTLTPAAAYEMAVALTSAADAANAAHRAATQAA